MKNLSRNITLSGKVQRLHVSLVILCFLVLGLLQSSPIMAGETNNEMTRFLTNMPKAELHLHIEGSLSPEKTAELARNNKLGYFSTAEEVIDSLKLRQPGLDGFLSHYFKSIKVLVSEQDFFNATYDLIRLLAKNNVVYTDLFFDPQEHTQRDIPWSQFFTGINNAVIQGQKDFNVEVNLIMCLGRHLSAESAIEMLNQAEPYKADIIGLGMDSGPETGNPPIKFKAVYAEARKRGYKLTGHHDVHVTDSQKHLWQSINIIKMDRIDHGLDASQSIALMNALKENNLCLTGSPVKRRSNPEPQDLDWLITLDDNDVCVSINTDDPTHFETGYLNQMLIMVQQARNFSKERMTRFMLNAFKTIWEPNANKQKYIDKLKTYAVSNGVDWEKVVKSAPSK